MSIFMFLSFALECTDIVFDATYLREVTSSTFQLFFSCDASVYILMATFLFTGISKCYITVLLSKSRLLSSRNYDLDEFEMREIHLLFTFLLEDTVEVITQYFFFDKFSTQFTWFQLINGLLMFLLAIKDFIYFGKL